MLRLWFHVKLFLVTGLPFGALYALWASSVASGVVAGVFFGGFMSAIMGTVHWHGVRRWKTPSAETLKPRQRVDLVVPLAPDEAADRCASALAERSRRVEREGDELRIRTAAAWQCFGENVTCHFAPDGGGTRVSIESRPVVRTTVADYGTNIENVEILRKALTA